MVMIDMYIYLIYFIQAQKQCTRAPIYYPFPVPFLLGCGPGDLLN